MASQGETPYARAKCCRAVARRRPARIYVALALLGVPLFGGCDAEGPLPTCETVSLVDHEVWEPLPMEMDPFQPAPGDRIYECREGIDTGPEVVNEELQFHVLTGFCNWATYTQPLEEPLAAGEQLYLKLLVYQQVEFPGVVATVGVAVGEEIVFTDELIVPTAESKFYDVAVPLSERHEAGEPICFHVGNHGTNSWNIIDLAVQRGDACEMNPPEQD